MTDFSESSAKEEGAELERKTPPSISGSRRNGRKLTYDMSCCIL
jgi:hypothetical protein